MKRFVTIILALSIAVLGSVPALAKEDFTTELKPFVCEDYPVPAGDAYFKEEDAVEIEDDGFESIFFNSPSIPFEDYIVEKLLAHSSKIDVSAYGLATTDFRNKYYDVLLRHPELMVKTQYRPYTENGVVKSIDAFYYFDTSEETAEASQKLSDIVDEYVAFAQNAPDDLGKLLLVHEKIAYDYSYDEDYIERGESGDRSAHHPLGFILRGSAVCQGYAGLLYAVASELGIEADFCNADVINHIWNYVKIDGKWYHVDLTWDDPTYYKDEAQTQLVKSAYHGYFLRSDADFETTHGAKSTYNRFGGELYECSSDKFEENHLFNIPYLLLINYTNGNYVLQADSEVTFEYPTLYTGPMLVTKPYEWTAPDGVTPVYKIVYVYGGKANREYISFLRRDKGNSLAIAQKFFITDNLFHYSMLQKNGDGALYSFYFFDKATLAPLSVKHTVVDN